jgi:hypothetical protein
MKVSKKKESFFMGLGGAGGSPYKMTDRGGFFSQWTAPMGRRSHCVVGTSSIAFAIVDMRESESNCEIGMAFMKEEVLGSDL